MDATKTVPMIVTGAPDEVGSMVDMFPNPEINYAEDEEVMSYIQAHVQPVIFYARQHRKTLEEEWRETRRMVLLQHDGNQKYIGRSQAYLPLYKQARQSLVSLLTRGLFPSDDYMDVESQDQNPGDDGARAVKEYLQYEFERCAKMRVNIKPFLTQFLDYGWSVGKVWFHKELKQRSKTKLRKNAMGMAVPSMEKDAAIQGLRFRTRSVFNFYVWPPTVDQLEDASLVFEDCDVHKHFIEEMGRKGVWKNTEEALNAPYQPDHGFNLQEQMMEMTGNATIPQTAVPGGDLSHWRTLQECWLMMALPDAAYVEGEEKGTPVRVKLVLAGNTVVEASRQPFWHNQLPYLVPRLNPEPGSFYVKGLGYSAKYMQYLINDISNQLNDNMTYGLNPMAKVNPSTLAGPLSPLRPGGVWLTTDPKNGIEFDRPPVEQVQHGLQVLNTWVSMLNDTIGAPPILQGSNAGKGARTATSSQILQKNAMNPIQDIVEDLEAEVMLPLMQMAFSLGQQYREDDFWVPITGSTPIRITPQMLVGEFAFRWLASSQASNQQQRAQQALQFLQMIGPTAPLLQAQGKMINPVPILKRVYADGFGWRGFDQVVVDAPQPMMGPPGMGGGPGGPGGEVMPNVRAANEGQLQPGEGDEFASVRDGADAMAGAMGGNQ
jgi:hypothetical protein